MTGNPELSRYQECSAQATLRSISDGAVGHLQVPIAISLLAELGTIVEAMNIEFQKLPLRTEDADSPDGESLLE